VASANII